MGRKKISDKERLDWLESEPEKVLFCRNSKEGKFTIATYPNKSSSGDTIRQAIDAEIRKTTKGAGG